MTYSNGPYQYTVTQTIPAGDFSYLTPTTQYYIDTGSGLTHDSPVYYKDATGTWKLLPVEAYAYITSVLGPISDRTTYGTGAPV